MTLQRKFILLIVLLGASVSLSLGMAIFSFGLLQQEVADRFADMAGELNALSEIKQELTSIASSPPGVEEASVTAASVRMMDSLERLETHPTYLEDVGRRPAEQLRERLTLLGGPGLLDADRREEARLAIRLVTSMEDRLSEGVRLAVGHADALRGRLVRVVSIALSSTLLVCALSVLLVRRWVLRPVTDLRRAAGEFASGNLSHRAPVRGADELGLLSAEVNQMAETVAAMQEERIQRERLAATGEMIRQLAHNLRNPLSGIRGLAELTRSRLQSGSDEHENQGRILATVDRFEKWLSDLLSSTTPLEIQLADHDPRRWLEGAIGAHRPAAEVREISIRSDVDAAPASARFDAARLEQALVAVLSNAIELSPDRGLIQVTAAVCEDGQSWQVRVEDQGPGVASELTERIFEPHFSRKTGGFGIGLAVAQKVAIGHGGRIAVEQGLARPADTSPMAGNGHGAAFVIRLPISGGKTEADHSDAASRSSATT